MHELNLYLRKQLGDHLLKRQVVVLYDPRRELEPFLDELEVIGNGRGGLSKVVVDDERSVLPLVARFEGSLFELRARVEPIVARDKPEHLLVYLPGVERDRKGSVLMELEKGGHCYQPQLKRLALNVLRQYFTDGDIDEMMSSGSVGYGDIVEFLRQSSGGGPASMLKTIFGDEQSEPLLARWIADESKDRLVVEKNAVNELVKLIESRLGLTLKNDSDVQEARLETVRYILVNEFRSDLTCEPPESLRLLPSPPAEGHLRRLREVAARLRRYHGSEYEALADQVERALGLPSVELDPAHLGSIDTFRFEERRLLEHAGELAASGCSEEALEVVNGRSRSFWADRDIARQAQWVACRLAAELAREVSAIHSEVKALGSGPDRWIEAYAARGGWHRADRIQRSLEGWIAGMDEEPETNRAIRLALRGHEDLLERMSQKFCTSLVEADWTVANVLHQSEVFPGVVQPMNGRTAYFLVDAMRYEMGVELAGLLRDAEDVVVRPAMAALPTITPVGMAALMPGASLSFTVLQHRESLAAAVEGQVLADSRDRMKHLKARRPEARDITLDDLLHRTKKSLAQSLSKVPFLVVRSPEIDKAGESGGKLLARQFMGSVVSNIARAVRKLASLKYTSFVMTSDHGHLFGLEKREDMLMDRPGGDTVDHHRRCWCGRGGRTPRTCVRVTGAQLGYDTDLDFVFPRGLAVFKAGGDLAYHHGGVSLQEAVIPVVTLRIPTPQAEAEPGMNVELIGCPTEVTNRIFSLQLEVTGLLMTESLDLRVVLVSEQGEVVGRTAMAVGGELDRTRGVLRVEPGTRANLGLMLNVDDVRSVRIVVQDPGTDAVLEQSDKIPVKVAI